MRNYLSGIALCFSFLSAPYRRLDTRLRCGSSLDRHWVSSTRRSDFILEMLRWAVHRQRADAQSHSAHRPSDCCELATAWICCRVGANVTHMNAHLYPCFDSRCYSTLNNGSSSKIKPIKHDVRQDLLPWGSWALLSRRSLLKSPGCFLIELPFLSLIIKFMPWSSYLPRA